MTKLRPWEILPQPPPSEFDPSTTEPDYFYNNIIMPLTKDFIRLMSAGIQIDQSAVDDLRTTITEVLAKVESDLASNPLIQDFQAHEYPRIFNAYKEEQEASMRSLDFYIKEYRPDDIVHRTYLVNTYLLANDLEKYITDKCTVKDLKVLHSIHSHPFFIKVLNKSIELDDPYVVASMRTIATEKLAIWNKVRQDKIDNASMDTLLPPFNPGSAPQKQRLFHHLGVEPLAFSKDTGLPSWGRPQIEELFKTSQDGPYKDLLQNFIDHSFGAIIRNNFLEAFDKFTIDGVLHGNFKLFGAKTFRPTSNSPNMLNAPSTGSIYAKPLKKCFVAPPGYLVWTIDYAALEDRVIANLSHDENKLAVFTEGIDGHSLGATYYFPDEVSALIGSYTDNKQAARDLKALVDDGNKDAKSIRQNGKPVTFKLAYGGYPDVDKGGFITKEIFDAYHNEMYPSISEMRDEAVSTARGQSYLHLGLGCRIHVDDVDSDSRTLFNALSQFWSVLTLIALNELHHHIDTANLGADIIPTSTIYDAIYGIVKDDAETIKWLNDTVVPIMSKDFLDNQTVHNEANLEIGTSWASVTELPIDATLEHIQGVLDGV